jgi:hypothetical protein
MGVFWKRNLELTIEQQVESYVDAGIEITSHGVFAFIR